MQINVALSGSNGRMGKSIIKAINSNPEFNLEFNIAVQLTKTNNNLLAALTNTKKNIDVLIDFSTTASCLEYLEICQQLKIPMVIGTTGFTAQQKEKIANIAEHIPVLLAPNMSVGANICNYLLACISKLSAKNGQFDSKIIIKEVHHKHKLDAPSGTAVKMAEIIKKNFAILEDNHSIQFISKRIGNVKGRHQVKFANKFEEIIINHNVKNRSVFANGALLAAKWLVNKDKPYKLYSLLDVMNLEEMLQTGISF